MVPGVSDLAGGPVNPGDLRHQIVIQSKDLRQDSFGAETPTWSTFATVWAAVEPLRGREYLEAKHLQAEVDVRFRIRYRDGLLPSMRISYDGRLFDIMDIIHVKEHNRELQLMAKERIDETG